MTGDDRPSVYWDESTGMWVYRASAVGRCERALRYARKQTPARGVFAGMQKAMDESAGMEDEIIQRFTDEFQVDVSHRQHVVIIPVNDDAHIRGSIDGLGTTEIVNFVAPTGLVEVKAFGDEYWEMFKAQGIAAWPGYVSQFHLYCLGLIKQGIAIDGGWFVVGHKVKGKVVEIRYEWVPFKHAAVAKAIAVVDRVEAWAKGADFPDGVEEAACDGGIVCGYWYLHDDANKPEGVVELPRLRGLLLERDRCLNFIKTSAERADELKVEIDELSREKLRQEMGADADDVKTIRVGAGNDWWKVTQVEGSNTTKWNKDKLEKFLGKNVDKYRTTSKGKGSVRITKAKDEAPTKGTKDDASTEG